MKCKHLHSIWVLALVFLLSTCAAPTNDVQAHEKDTYIAQDVHMDEGIYYDKDWDETIGTYTNAVAEHQETAMQIAIAVLNGIIESGTFEQYQITSIFNDTEDDIWIFGATETKYLNMDADVDVGGGGCSIAIQKQDGAVLRIWFGE